MTLLLKGDYTQGWAEYEWRKVQDQATPRNFSQPAWDGQPLGGKTLLVYAEQGLGDFIQFSRYLPYLKALGGPVLIEMPTPLSRLFAPLASWCTRIPTDQPLPAFDCHIALMSLPYVLGLNHIPPPLPDFAIPDLDLSKVSKGVTEDGYLRVGLVWLSSAQSPTAAKRSCPLELLLPLTHIPGIQWFSLQKEISPGQAQALKNAGIFDCSPDLEDFAATGAWMKHLDLVVTVDTAVAHLAGSLGIPTLILLPFIPDWRWQLQRSDSPWYASVQLLRQTQPQAWASVISQITRLLPSQRPKKEP
jgi:hypothetical protein